MSPVRVFGLTLLAMIAFAGNSLLCRLALKNTGIDAASFTAIRILSGALCLWLIVRLRGGTERGGAAQGTAGALASGLGYAIWYTALKGLRATSAATVQLSVPVIAALGGIAVLGEHLTGRLLIASTAILGGIALVIFNGQPAK